MNELVHKKHLQLIVTPPLIDSFRAPGVQQTEGFSIDSSWVLYKADQNQWDLLAKQDRQSCDAYRIKVLECLPQ